MPPTSELVGRVGRLSGQHAPTEQGLTLTVRVLPGRGQGLQRVTACALTADTLGLATQQGEVYVVHLTKQRFVCLDKLQSACTSAAFMTRLSRRLFVGCADGGIHCYDVSTSSHLAQLPGHRTAVGSLSTKSDTEQLLSASADAVLLWDMATFRQRRMLGEAPYGSSKVAFSTAGNLLAAASPAGTITLWDAKSLREVATLQAPQGQQQQHFSVSSISISPDEQLLLAACKAPALLLLYSVQDRRLQCALRLAADMFGVVQAQVLPDSTSAAVLTSNGCISFVDLQGRCISGRLHLTAPGCRAVEFSTDPRANTMAVVCSDGLLRLYDLGVVRAQQQKHGQQPQQQNLQELTVKELQQLPATAEVLPASAQLGDAAGRSKASDTRILSDVGNLERSSSRGKAGKAKEPSRPPAAGSSAGVAAGQLQVRPLSGPAAALNTQKLQEVLLAYGQFPTQYRRLIWEHLLQLPHNSAAFALLQDQGMHPAYKNLASQLQAPGSSTSTAANRLAACLSQLAHWCPLFGEAGFLPEFAFPFVKLFGPRAESSFEALVVLLLNWCKGWFELFPNPPVPLLQRFLLMLSQHDLQLGSHLQQLGTPLLERLWSVMSSGMSDLLPAADDWLVLWDHCLAAAAAGPAFYYTVLAAYLISQRSHLLTVTNKQELDRVFEARPAVDVRKMIKLAHQLHERTPDYARLGFSSLSVLPAGDTYPVFSEYPTGSVELQQLERQRIQEAEEALIRRRQVVAELQQRSKQVAFEAAALTSQRQQLAALDAQRRAAIRAIEDSLATAGARLDDRAKEEKLRQIRLAEEAYQASLASLRAEWSAELAALKTDVAHKRRVAAAALKARQEEEDIKALEFQAQQRLWALQQEEVAAAGSSALRDAAATQASALAAQLQRKAADWSSEDEARSLKQQHELARKARLAAAAEQEAALQAAKGLLLAQELQTQEELAKVEHQRRLRQLAEAEAELTAQQVQLQAERQAVAAAAERQGLQEKAAAATTRLSQQQAERAAAVTAARESLQEQLAHLHLAAADLGSSARLSEAQQQLRHMEATLDAADREHAARVASMLEKLQGEQGRSSQAEAAGAPTGGVSALGPEPNDSSGTQLAEEGHTALQAHPWTSLEAVESRLAAIRQRRAALEDLYGVQVDAEVQRLITAGQQQRQQSLARSTHSPGGGGPGEARPSLSLPTSYAPAGSGSSGGSSRGSQATSGSSVDVSAELEHLLAEAEAEVQLELAAAKAALRGSGLYPHSSTRSSTLQLQYPSLQSSVGRGRGKSTTGSVAQGSHTVSTSARGDTGHTQAAASAAPAAAATSLGGRLGPVLEEPAGGHQQSSAAAAAGGGVPAAGAGGPRTADSSSSSSSSPDKDGKPKHKAAAAGSAGQQAAEPALPGSSMQPSTAAGAAAGAAAAAEAGPGSGTGSSSSHGSVKRISQVPVAPTAVQPSPAAEAGAYRPVLLPTPGRSRASADTECFLTALSGGDGAQSGPGDSSGSSVSKPSSLSFGVPAASVGQLGGGPSITPTLGHRTQARTGTAAALQASQGAADSGSSSSVAASLRSAGHSWQQSGSEVDDAAGPAAAAGAVVGLSSRVLEPSGRVSSQLRQSSSATSEELEQLLQQLSQYEEHLLAEAQSGGSLPPEMAPEQQLPGHGEVYASMDSSVSWSQTLAGLTGLNSLLQPGSSSSS